MAHFSRLAAGALDRVAALDVAERSLGRHNFGVRQRALDDDLAGRCAVADLHRGRHIGGERPSARRHGQTSPALSRIGFRRRWFLPTSIVAAVALTVSPRLPGNVRIGVEHSRVASGAPAGHPELCVKR